MFIKFARVMIIGLLLAFSCGCANNTSDFSTTSDSNDTITQTGISADDAKAAIESRLPEEPYDFVVELQGKDTENNREYYRFQIYTLGTEPLADEQGSFYQQFTYAWIYVDIQTGALYKRNTETQRLVEYLDPTIDEGAFLP